MNLWAKMVPTRLYISSSPSEGRTTVRTRATVDNKSMSPSRSSGWITPSSFLPRNQVLLIERLGDRCEEDPYFLLRVLLRRGFETVFACPRPCVARSVTTLNISSLSSIRTFREAQTSAYRFPVFRSRGPRLNGRDLGLVN